MPERTTEPVGCMGLLLRIIGIGGGEPDPEPTPPFVRKDWLLSRAEHSFLGVLDRAIQDEFRVMCKVRMLDLLYMPKGSSDRTAWQNRVIRKHVDFVLCEPDTMRPALVIELDDASHQSEKAKAGDRLKDRIFGAAGLPILRVAAKRMYHVAGLRESIDTAMDFDRAKPSV